LSGEERAPASTWGYMTIGRNISAEDSSAIDFFPGDGVLGTVIMKMRSVSEPGGYQKSICIRLTFGASHPGRLYRLKESSYDIMKPATNRIISFGFTS
jgi:hypothetical protein